METKKKIMAAARKTKTKLMMAPPPVRRGSRVQGTNLGLPTLNVEKEYNNPIDTSLYVGPIYDVSKQRKSAIKEQLGDITQRLHKTLHNYDALEEFEKSPPTLDILENLTRNIETMDKTQMKNHLETVMGQYREMSSSVDETKKEREELLLQVADWFSTDHVDLDDIKASVDDKEENEINKSYVETLTDFEKFKSLKDEIIRDQFGGKNTQFLEMEKRKIEMRMMEGLKNMKRTSMTDIKAAVANDAHWKHAAGEVVELLNKVRHESADERETLSKKVDEMLKQIERQEITIRQLKAEVKREKNVSAQLADENTDYSKEVTQMKGKLAKYEKDLEHAKRMIEKISGEQSAAEKKLTMIRSNTKVKKSVKDLEVESVKGSNLSVTLSSVITQYIEPEEGYDAREISSDPSLLRTMIRDLQTNLEIISKECSKYSDRVKELEPQNTSLVSSLGHHEERSRKLQEKVDQLESDLEYARLQAQKKPVAAPTPKSPERPQEPEVNLELIAAQEEIETIKEKNSSLKKSLYETEMKLSEAYKEIAELRMAEEGVKTTAPSPPKPSYPTPEPEEAEVEEKAESPEAVVEKEVVKPRAPARKEKPPPPARKKHVPRPTQRKSVLPPIRKKQGMVPPIEDQINRSDREAVLYNVGELQSMIWASETCSLPARRASGFQNICLALLDFDPRSGIHLGGLVQTGELNTIVQDILDYAASVGNLIYKDDQEQKVQQPTMTMFEFGRKPEPTKNKKQVIDNKDIENRDKKSQVFFLGQRACGLIREIYEHLTSSLNLLHEEFEMIYKSFKETEERRALERAMQNGKVNSNSTKGFLKGLGSMRGIQDEQLPQGTTAESLLSYYIKTYGHPKKGRQGGKKALTAINSAHSHSEHMSISVTSITSSLDSLTNKNLQNAVMVLGFHRSSSDLDLQSIGSASVTTLERATHTPVFLSNKFHLQEGFNREEARVAMTTVPKKGMIKLTALGEEHENPYLYESRSNKLLQDHEELEHERQRFSATQKKQKMLIRRKDVQEQILMGIHQLQEEEKLKEEHNHMEKELGEYTIGDLHDNLNQLTGISKKTDSQLVGSDQNKQKPKKQKPAENPKTVNLPAINMINPF